MDDVGRRNTKWKIKIIRKFRGVLMNNFVPKIRTK